MNQPFKEDKDHTNASPPSAASSSGWGMISLDPLLAIIHALNKIGTKTANFDWKKIP